MAPGRGDLGSFSSFSTVMTSDQTFLADIDLTLDRIHRSLDLAVGGETFDLASERMTRANAHVGRVASSLKRASDAVEEYQDTIAEIKRKAAIAEQQLAAARMALSKTYMDSTTAPPSQYELDRRDRESAEAQCDHDEATETLSKLARQRQAADDKLVAELGDSAYELVDVDLITRLPTDRNDLFHTQTYEYHYKYNVASSQDFSPEEAMSLFQDNPVEIFPFGIEGATRFVDGDTIRLVDATGLPLVDDTGWVRVSTTPTSVTFTVVSNDYFDGQGSTITFQTAERDGQIYLEQLADARDANWLVEAGVNEGSASATWATQAENFRDVLERAQK